MTHTETGSGCECARGAQRIQPQDGGAVLHGVCQVVRHPPALTGAVVRTSVSMMIPLPGSDHQSHFNVTSRLEVSE